MKINPHTLNKNQRLALVQTVRQVGLALAAVISLMLLCVFPAVIAPLWVLVVLVMFIRKLYLFNLMKINSLNSKD